MCVQLDKIDCEIIYCKIILQYNIIQYNTINDTMSNLQFYSFKEFQTMPYIPYDNCQRSPIQYAPIQHIRVNSIQGYPHTRPQSIHPYTHIIDNTYSSGTKIKSKRNVSWKNENLVGITFSKDDYDRTIDSLQIRKNIQDIRQYHLAKLQPLTRQPSVSEDLFDMDLERDDI